MASVNELSLLRKRLRKRYLLVLFSLGALLSAGFFTFIFYFRTIETDSHIVNVSGQQRMLSQRITLLLTEARNETNQERVKELKSKLNSALDVMELNHNKLVVNVVLNPTFQDIFFGKENNLNQTVNDFIASARNTLAMGGRASQVLSIEKVDKLLSDLDKTVTAFENEGAIHARTIIHLQVFGLIFGIAALTASGFFVFRPMTTEIVEITRSLRLEQKYTNLLLDVAVIANESRTMEEAIEKTLACICRHTYWPVGHAFKPSEDNHDLLVSARLWYSQRADAFKNFVDVTEKSSFKTGEGLPGRVLQHQRAIWISDVTQDQNFPRNKLVTNIGLRSAFAFPIVNNGKIISVLEFYAENVIKEDETLMKIVAHVGRQLGQVDERERLTVQLFRLGQTLEWQVSARTEELRLKNKELARRQQKLIQSSKMSALGEMAAGVAHEINNPLAVLHLRAEQMKELLESADLDRALMTEMTTDSAKMVSRIAKIVKGLKSFARDGGSDPLQSAPIEAIVNETLDLCKERFKNNNTALEIVIPETPINIQCRPTQISQVLLNLLNNAFDAVQRLSEKWVRLEVVDRPKFIEVMVTDSGHGIPVEIADRIMQPFFTTKEAGKGTGLGLSISREIIQAHGGQLVLAGDKPNTQFVILLPKDGGAQKGQAA